MAPPPAWGRTTHSYDIVDGTTNLVTASSTQRLRSSTSRTGQIADATPMPVKGSFVSFTPITRLPPRVFANCAMSRAVSLLSSRRFSSRSCVPFGVLRAPKSFLNSSVTDSGVVPTWTRRAKSDWSRIELGICSPPSLARIAFKDLRSLRGSSRHPMPSRSGF